jgi:patatin-like phospholipase/acyl hydrolase
MPAYRILSFDGGGVRGVLTARLLHRIAEKAPGLLDNVDLLAGTSTGAIIAASLAVGNNPATIVDLYLSKAEFIFHTDFFHSVGHLWGLNGSKYSTENRKQILQDHLGSKLLGEIAQKILIPTFELDSQNLLSPADPEPRKWKAKFFHNYAIDNDNTANPDTTHRLVDVVVRSSAAPVFFPIYQGFIDGGVVANNPSMCALAQAINNNTGGQDIKNVTMLSIGTGFKPQFIDNTNGDWGLHQWGFQLLDLLLDASAGLADFQCRELLGDRYCRVNVDLELPIGLDAVDRMPELIKYADDLFTDEARSGPIIEWVKKHWL